MRVVVWTEGMLPCRVQKLSVTAMTANILNPTGSQELDFRPGPTWSNFEQLRTSGQAALEPIKANAVGTLMTRYGQYRILAEDDFQRVLGLAREVHRLQRGMRLVITAVRAAQYHRDDLTMSTLVEVASAFGETPSLPTIDRFAPLQPEDFDVDPDDEVILDPTELERQIKG
jgi:hypothetical protein